MVRCHIPVSPTSNGTFIMIGFIDYKWYCPHNPELHEKIKKIGKYVIPVLAAVASTIVIIDYLTRNAR